MYRVLNTVSTRVTQFSNTPSPILLLPPSGPRSGETLPTLSYTRVTYAGSSLKMDNGLSEWKQHVNNNGLCFMFTCYIWIQLLLVSILFFSPKEWYFHMEVTKYKVINHANESWNSTLMTAISAPLITECQGRMAVLESRGCGYFLRPTWVSQWRVVWAGAQHWGEGSIMPPAPKGESWEKQDRAMEFKNLWLLEIKVSWKLKFGDRKELRKYVGIKIQADTKECMKFPSDCEWKEKKSELPFMRFLDQST